MTATPDDALLSLVDEPSGDERERFHIDGPKTADWALRKLAKHRQQIRDAEELALAEIARIDEWREAEVDRHKADIAFFAGLLAEWHRTLLGDDPDAKTVRLPAGTLKARKAPDVLDIHDPSAFSAWASLHHPDWLRHFENWAPDKQAIRKAARYTGDGRVVSDTGEVVPGVTNLQGAVTYTADTTGDKQ